MSDQAGWRAWSGGWRGGEPPKDWWVSADGRWYPPGVQRPPNGPTWRGSAAEYRPRQFADAGSRTAGGVSVVTRPHARSADEPDDDGGAPRHAAHRKASSRSRRGSAATGAAGRPAAAGSAQAEVRGLFRTTALVLAAALAAVVGLALWSIGGDDEPAPQAPAERPAVESVSADAPASTVAPPGSVSPAPAEGPAPELVSPVSVSPVSVSPVSVSPEAPASTLLSPAGEMQRVPSP